MAGQPPLEAADDLATLQAALVDPDVQNALKLTVEVAFWAVVINLVFGVGISLLLVRFEFPGKRVLSALIDLPMSVSPVVVGLALLLVYNGRDGWFGQPLEENGIQIIFASPGMIMATCFVALPLVIREVVPVLHEIGDDQEQAARSLGASAPQTFWRITVPAIRWGLTYGVVLTIARALGEFGAVIMVSSGFPGVSQTLTLLVHSRYIDDHNTFGAYSAATLLMGLALVTLLGMTLLDRKRSST